MCLTVKIHLQCSHVGIKSLLSKQKTASDSCTNWQNNEQNTTNPKQSLQMLHKATLITTSTRITYQIHSV